LHQYLQGFQKEKRTLKVPPQAVLGSEAHQRLRSGFAKVYDQVQADDDGRNEDGDAEQEEGRVQERVRDEL
jgi:hypothetical protein